LSPTLFSIFINDLSKEIDANLGNLNAVNIGETQIPCLIYADDILLMSNDINSLMNQIQIVNEYCKRNSLDMNFDKTKLIFQNIRYENDHIELNLNNELKRIDIVREYKYLGFWIGNNTKKHLSSLTKNGNKSAYLTAKKLKEIGCANGTIVKNTFEMLTLSKMQYGGEFCFYNKLSELNRIQFQFYKRFYHLITTTANYCLIGEFGLFPLEYHFEKAAINLWIKIIFNESSTIMKRCYNHVSNNLDNSNYSYTWCWRIKHLLKQINLSHLWLDQNSLEINKRKCKIIVKTRLMEHFRAIWINDTKKSRTGIDYLELSQFDCSMKSYLTLNLKLNIMAPLLKLRCRNHDLAVKTGCYRNRLSYDERLCSLCDDRTVETVYHFICKCALYNDIRLHFTPFFVDISKQDFYVMLETLEIGKIVTLTKYINSANSIRADKLRQRPMTS